MSQWLKSQPSNNTVSGVISSPSLYTLKFDDKDADDRKDRDWKIAKCDDDTGFGEIGSEVGDWN